MNLVYNFVREDQCIVKSVIHAAMIGSGYIKIQKNQSDSGSGLFVVYHAYWISFQLIIMGIARAIATEGNAIVKFLA